MQNSNVGNKPIGVFDSGVGGLSVLKELQKLLPHENFVFLADQAFLPYGEKTKPQLIDRVSKIADYFIQKHDVKMIIIACNTATVNTLDSLRAKCEFPIVGTVPAVKPATEKTRSKTIAVFSTTKTSKSDALKKLIEDNCKDINVINIASKGLATKVEQGDLNSPELQDMLKKYLDELKNSNVDVLVLGCTHYPFLKKPISEILGPEIKLLDSGKAIARRAEYLLQNSGEQNNSTDFGKNVLMTTGDSEKFSKVASKLLKTDIKTAYLDL